MSEKKPAGRRTVARHGRLRSPHPVAQLFRMIGVALAVVLVAGLGVVSYVTVDLSSSFAADAVDIGDNDDLPPSIAEWEGGVNLFIAGTDTCEPQYADLFGDRCANPENDGVRSDVNLLVHISDEPRKITVVSFPRDLMLPIPECTDANGNATSAMSKEMLNASFYYGGLGCTVSTIEELSGQRIHFAASVNWGGVIEITDAIGGVEVCVENGIKDVHTGLDLEAGSHTLQGLPALQFLRTRHGVGDGGDLGRISNQQQYMSKLARKLISEETLSNPTTLLKLANTGLKAVDPSTSLTNPYTLVQIALAVKDVPFDDIVFLQYPVYDDPADPNRVVPDYTSATVLWDALAANQSLEVTGGVGVGAIDEAAGVEGGETTDPTVTDPVVTPDPAVTPDPSATTPAVVALPSNIHGSSAAQDTCSNGNVRG